MKRNAVDALNDIITDLWVDWIFDSGDSCARDTARRLEKLSARIGEDESSFALGRLLGGEWAPSCRTKIEKTDALEPFLQIRGEELPPLFKEIESRLEGRELAVFRQGFGRAVSDYQGSKEVDVW